MVEEHFLIGVDGGTESIRAGVFDRRGALLASCASPYPTHFPYPSWAEQRAEDWWEGMGVAVRGAMQAAGEGNSDVGEVIMRHNPHCKDPSVTSNDSIFTMLTIGAVRVVI